MWHRHTHTGDERLENQRKADEAWLKAGVGDQAGETNIYTHTQTDKGRDKHKEETRHKKEKHWVMAGALECGSLLNLSGRCCCVITDT